MRNKSVLQVGKRYFNLTMLVCFLFVWVGVYFLIESNAEAKTSSSSMTEDISVIRLLMAYTPAVRGTSCSLGIIHNQIYQAVQEISQAFLDSAVNARIELAGVVEAEYTESDDLGSDLVELQNANGTLSNLHSLRDQLGADLVSLVVKDGADCLAGYASFPIVDILTNPNAKDYAFSVVKRNCMRDDLALAQAIGANLGTRLDWFSDEGVLPHEYSHGFINLDQGCVIGGIAF